VTGGVTFELNPEVGVPSEEVGTETWEVSERATHLCNQGKPRMHLTLEYFKSFITYELKILHYVVKNWV